MKVIIELDETDFGKIRDSLDAMPPNVQKEMLVQFKNVIDSALAKFQPVAKVSINPKRKA